jgi:hypothetical protein
MSTLNVRLPESLHRHLRELAKEDGVSVNQFITLAVAEKISALETSEYLRQRAARGRLADFDKVLSLVPDVEPEWEEDRVTSGNG